MEMIRYRKYFTPAVFMFLVILCFPALSAADKSSVTIEAPENAEKERAIIIRINVKHSGNNFLHYTDRVLSISLVLSYTPAWPFWHMLTDEPDTTT